jgi:CheY-like chemotaxis protein
MSSAPAPARTVSSTPAPSRSLSSTPAAPAVPTILVIEDYSDTRELLSGILRYQGYNVIEAEDGLQGLLKAIANYPDLIIMDLTLPEMDGIELARRIHGEPKLARTPIFVVSAYLTEAIKSDARTAGCIEAIAKPFDAEALLEKISRVLSANRD